MTLFSEPYDAASTVLVGDGVDASKATLDELLGAIEKIEKANQDGQFRRFTGNDYTTDLAKGNVALSMAYSGDVVSLQSDNPDLRFAYPEEGNVIFTDELMMPTGVENAVCGRDDDRTTSTSRRWRRRWPPTSTTSRRSTARRRS